jgi:hypothetical protein
MINKETFSTVFNPSMYFLQKNEQPTLRVISRFINYKLEMNLYYSSHGNEEKEYLFCQPIIFI